ncbi:pseudouridine synthase [Parapedobacter pyrenivorans]|uniref:pseudouridine synthase n=1 Tax=Parapedobacter pyrenivorans TaxID=1305674 RepID=UPI0016676024|nr:pseudouridine synthase [Parapedobacter pyrenivorans]
MPFSNKRNSRDDKSRRTRKSTSSFSNPKEGKFRSHDTPGNDKRQPNTKSGNFGEKRRGSEQSSNPDRDSAHKRSGQKPPYGKDKPYSRENRGFGGKPFDPTKKRRERTDIRPKPATWNTPQDDGLIRLNRYIANAGVCSRRKADELIEAGVVTVNGQVITELGVKVDPAKDEVRYNGERLKREKMVYVLLNKPKDYITTTDDPQERRTVMQLVTKATRERIYPVGRLDRNTTGLLLLTNDGNLAERLSHPRNNVVKIYNVELDKNLTQGDFNKITFGLELEDGFVKPDTLSYVQGGSKREIGIQIHSGKNRIVRRIFEHLGYDVVKLDRVVYANLTKKDLTRGRWRYLEEKEIIQLKHFIK